MTTLENESVVQVAIIVDDIEKYTAAYAEVFGIAKPSWKLTDVKDVSHVKYMGKDTEARAKLAFIKLANLSIEIIEPVGGPSVWADHLKKHGPSVHHVAFRYKDKTPMVDLLTKTLQIVQTGDFTGGSYTYIKADDKLAMDIEILENPGM